MSDARMSERHSHLGASQRTEVRLLHTLPTTQMTDAQKRQYVANLYDGHKWKKRVEKMRDDQVTAIYLKHMQEGTMPAEHLEGEEPEQEHLDIPPQPPHANEDDFPIY